MEGSVEGWCKVKLKLQTNKGEVITDFHRLPLVDITSLWINFYLCLAKGGAERTKAVDLEGAIRTFDAIQLATTSGLSNFNRFILVSAVDSRDLNIKPRWYSEEDFEKSRKSREALGYYYQCKYEADKNLHDRSKKGDLTFPWFVLRPSTLQDESGTGKVNLGEQKGIAGEFAVFVSPTKLRSATFFLPFFLSTLTAHLPSHQYQSLGKM